ncbi:MAG: hypothetical protein CMK56_08315 [Proteobacteria bacterium]|nr:hypothetical protein [Pseudomonadota bacterium]|tara:strand:+ start:235 stop:549 length:315 start_codon:yes stop_codon:yes gene_type:complete
MKYTLTTATEDSPIFRQGFVISPPNYGQVLEQSKAKSLENNDEQKGISSQFIRTASDDKPVLNEDSVVASPITKSNSSSPGKSSRLKKPFRWSNLLINFFRINF